MREEGEEDGVVVEGGVPGMVGDWWKVPIHFLHGARGGRRGEAVLPLLLLLVAVVTIAAISGRSGMRSWGEKQNVQTVRNKKETLDFVCQEGIKGNRGGVNFFFFFNKLLNLTHSQSHSSSFIIYIDQLWQGAAADTMTISVFSVWGSILSIKSWARSDI